MSGQLWASTAAVLLYHGKCNEFSNVNSTKSSWKQCPVFIHVYCALLSPPSFCLGTEVPRHSAGCVGTYVVRGTWYVVRGTIDILHIYGGTYVAFRNAPAQVLHACSTPLIGCQTYL